MDFDFKIGEGELGNMLLNKGISRFSEACEFVRNLPFKRNSDKLRLELVILENRGTCGTKHAFLTALARENGKHEIKLITGIFKMSAITTPTVKQTLEKFGLTYIPEAHNYLKVNGEILDCTSPGFLPSRYNEHLMQEVETEPWQVADDKIMRHREFLYKWLQQSTGINYTLDELWAIRELCVADLQAAGF